LDGDGRKIGEVRHPDRWTLLYRYPDGHYALYRRWGRPSNHEIIWIESRGEVFSALARRLPIEDLVLLWWSLGSEPIS
jgi:hypothetical protein